MNLKLNCALQKVDYKTLGGVEQFSSYLYYIALRSQLFEKLLALYFVLLR